MRRTNKIISVILALIMILSSVSFSLFASAKVDVAGLVADPKNGIVQGYVTENGNANGINATVLFDWLDKEILPPLTNEKVFGKDAADLLDTLSGLGIKVNLRSIDNILKTLDTVKSANSSLGTIIKSIFNGYALVTKNWTKNQSRSKTGDYAILKNFLQFLDDNEKFLGAFVANKTGDTINMETLLGSGNDLYHYIKKAVAKLIYNYEIKDENGKVIIDPTIKAKYDAAVNMTLDDIIFKCGLGDGVNSLLASLDNTIRSKYVDVENPNEVWSFLYKDKGFKFEGSLNGYTYDQSMTLDATVTAIINTIYQNNKEAIKALFAQYGERLQNAIVSTEWGAPFAAVLKLNTTDLSFLDNMSMSNSLKSFNTFAGAFVTGVTEYTKWDNDKNFGYNFEQMFMWAIDAANASGVENNPYAGTYKSGDFTSYALTLAKIIVRATVKDESTVALLDGCTSAKQVITKLLPTLVKDSEGNSVVGAKSTTYTKVLGDILGYYLNQVAILYTDTDNTTRYTPGSGKTYLEVLNYAANYYLCDLSFDTFLGVDLSKSDDFLTKLDKLQAVLFTGVEDLEYSKASTVIPGVIDAIINLDVESLVKVGFEDAFTNINVKVSAANLLYAMINNTLKGTLGVRVFEGDFASLDNMISNNSLEKACSNLLVGLNNKKNVLLPIAVYLFSALSDQSYLVLNADKEVTVNGSAAKANVSVVNSYTNKALTNGTDYVVTTEEGGSGIEKVTVSGKGDFTGSYVYDLAIKCTTHAYEWIVTKEASYTEKGTKIYKCKYCYDVSRTSTIATLAPAKVADLKASSTKTTSLKLSWSKAAGAASYEVYRSTDGSKWTKIATTTSTSVKVGSLTEGKTYQFKVRAVSEVGKNGSYSDVLKTGTLPVAVTGLKASTVTATSVKLTWTKVSNAASYEVYRSTDGSKWTKVATPTSASATVTGLTANKTYQFKARAVTSAGKKGEYSAVVKATTLPAQVTGLKASTITATSVKLTWTKATGAAKYQVYRSTNGESWKLLGTVTTNSYTASGLSAKTAYQFRVRAVSSADAKGAYSAVVKATTLTSQVTGLKASTITATSVKLTWTKVSDASKYEVYRSTDGKSWTKLGTVTTNSYTASGLTAKKAYQFKVRAVLKTNKNGTYSAVVKATTLTSQVTGLKASTITATSVKLTWTKVSDASKYEVYRSTDGKKWTKLGTVTTNSYTASGLTAKKAYQFKVRAVLKTNKNGTYSAVVKATTLTSKTTGLKASTVATTSIKLTWTKVSDASKYEVYRSTDGKTWKKLATVTSNSYTAKSLTAGKKYQFKVRAVLKTGKNGEYSAVLKTGTQTKAVTNLKATSTKSNKVDVSWTKATGATKYIVQYTTDKNFKSNVKTTTVTTNSATVSQSTSLFGTTTLYVKVIAVNAYDVNSAESSTVSVTVKK